ncbi:MAG TPA: acyltransferase domain-containing protein [Oscillospiraceae bacterium]|nr:acyltransferase domain-containing protein [Oscillospiraceae bacterium]
MLYYPCAQPLLIGGHRLKKYAFVFPGYGCGHPGMGKSFLESSEACLSLYAAASADLGYDCAALSVSGKAAEINDPEKAFPLQALQSLSVALCAKDILPEAPSGVLGYSAGEIPAVACAGVFSYGDAVKAASYYSAMRAEALGAGKMESFRLTNVKQEFVGLVTDKMTDGFVQLTAVEGPEQTVILGDREGIQATLDELAKHKVVSYKLENASVFHTMIVSAYASHMREAMNALPHEKSLSVPLYSTLYGKRWESILLPGDYFYLQQIKAVRLSEAVEAAAKDGVEVFLIAGKDRPLQTAVKSAAKGAEVLIAEDVRGLEKAAAVIGKA